MCGARTLRGLQRGPGAAGGRGRARHGGEGGARRVQHGWGIARHRVAAALGVLADEAVGRHALERRASAVAEHNDLM